MDKYRFFLQATPPRVIHRISERAAGSKPIELLLAKAGNQNATSTEMETFDNLVNSYYTSWKQDQHALELELGMPKGWEVHGLVNVNAGRENYRVMSAAQ